jgi:hypothetical protein
MTSINYKRIATRAIDLLMSEYEEQFDDLYERGEIGDSGKDYEDQRANWVDDKICIYLSITPKQLDEFLHGELESDTEYVLRTASEKLNDNLDESSFEDDQSYQQAVGRLDGLSDALGAVMMLEHKNSTTHNPREVLRQCFDVED